MFNPVFKSESVNEVIQSVEQPKEIVNNNDTANDTTNDTTNISNICFSFTTEFLNFRDYVAKKLNQEQMPLVASATLVVASVTLVVAHYYYSWGFRCSPDPIKTFDDDIAKYGAKKLYKRIKKEVSDRNKIRPIAADLKMWLGLSDATYLLGRYYHCKQDYPKALKYYKKHTIYWDGCGGYNTKMFVDHIKTIITFYHNHSTRHELLKYMGVVFKKLSYADKITNEDIKTITDHFNNVSSQDATKP